MELEDDDCLLTSAGLALLADSTTSVTCWRKDVAADCKLKQPKTTVARLRH